ncbi:MAG: hypothetical protein OES38_11140, partial [Gammaproteobacteria bacterium]|nr:hypothetical protein [Gammaproteobacteria bacterium]
AVVTLPQFANDRIIVKYVSKREHQKISRFTETRRGAGVEYFAIDLGNIPGALPVDVLPREVVRNRQLYYTPASETDAPHLRLGFFSEAKAASVLDDVRGTYPDARAVRVTLREAEYASLMRVNSERIGVAYRTDNNPERTPEVAAVPSVSIVTATSGKIEDRPEAPVPEVTAWRREADSSILRDAKDAYIARDFSRAVGLYTKAMSEPSFRREAMEMLAVSRENNRQLAHAKQVYEQYLSEYPSGAATDRVQARLTALVSIDQAPIELHEAKRKPSVASWGIVGNLSQFYQRHSLDIDGRDTIVPIDALFSDLNVVARRATSNLSHEGRVSIGHMQDFSDSTSSRSRDIRINTLYWDTSSSRLRTGLRLGRQRERDGGVLGRFDGLSGRFQATSNIELGVMAGYLADSSFDTPNTDRPFYAVNATFTLLDERLELTPFFVSQQYDGVTDRQAIGLQAEYYTDRASIFTLVDYDAHHSALNRYYLASNWRFSKSMRMNATYDFRRSPYLTTRNALIGQRLDDLSELEELLIEETLEDVAADRTASGHLIRLSIDGDWGSRWWYSIDASASDFSETDASLNVQGLESRQAFYYSAQLRANDLFGDNSYGSVQLRYSDSDTAQSVGVYLNNRITLGSNWWLYPRVLVDSRTMSNRDDDQLRIKPSLRVDYRLAKRFRLEAEAGYEWTTRDTMGDDFDIKGLFFRVGYRALF